VRRSKAGLIVAIIAVLAVGGVVAAFAVQGGKGDGKGSNHGSNHGSNDGSQVVINDHGSDRDHGSARGSDPGGSHRGSDHGADRGAGSATIPHDGSGSAGGSDSGSDHSPDRGSDTGSNTPPPTAVIPVFLVARNGVAFDVYENGAKLFEGPDKLEVPKGDKRTVVIKARGFKDKTLVVDGNKKALQFSLERIANNGGSGGSGHTIPPPPPGPDCSNSIVAPASKACVAQYCAKHPEDQNKCGLE
jgi:hypothetical protein